MNPKRKKNLTGPYLWPFVSYHTNFTPSECKLKYISSLLYSSGILIDKCGPVSHLVLYHVSRVIASYENGSIMARVCYVAIFTSLPVRAHLLSIREIGLSIQSAL